MVVALLPPPQHNSSGTLPGLSGTATPASQSIWLSSFVYRRSPAASICCVRHLLLEFCDNYALGGGYTGRVAVRVDDVEGGCWMQCRGFTREEVLRALDKIDCLSAYQRQVRKRCIVVSERADCGQSD